MFNEKYPLLARAWVLQERLLAPRTLHIFQTEIAWECMEGSHCECTYVSEDPALRTANMATLLKPSYWDVMTKRQPDPDDLVKT